MKTVSVRIDEEQARRLHEIADMIPGSGINALVKRGVGLFLDTEGPVYLAALKQAQVQLQERQPVMPVRAAELKAVQN